MRSVHEALQTILSGVDPLAHEQVSLFESQARVTAAPVISRLTQPPFNASAMDGYAVRYRDARRVGQKLSVIGEAAAGKPFHKDIIHGQAVRVFTGGVLPPGADHVVIQEEVSREGDQITINLSQEGPRHIRLAGIDFHEGETIVNTGTRLHAIHNSLLAAANISTVIVHRRPKVALFTNGDELRPPGSVLEPGQVIDANHYGLAALLKSWGADVDFLGCTPDDKVAIRGMFDKARNADVIIPIGGASVGDRDFVKDAFRQEGGKIAFEKVAVRPGKPTWYGALGNAACVGLPGNPASALVTALLFVRPLVARLSGISTSETMVFQSARLATSLPINGPREAYLRASFGGAEEGGEMLQPADNQDSSLLLPFSKADALIRRLPSALPAAEGDWVEYISTRSVE